MRLQIVAYPLLALTFSACNLLSGKCTYEVRTLDATGEINQGGAPFVSAQFTVSEDRGSLQSQSAFWLITSTSLKGHVLSAAFKDSSKPSQILLELPVASADRPEVSQGTATSVTGANLAGFHDLLAAGRGIIELQTDLSSQPTIIVQLSAATVGDWVRPNCS